MTVMKITTKSSDFLITEKKILSEKKVAGRPAFGAFPETSNAEEKGLQKKGGELAAAGGQKRRPQNLGCTMGAYSLALNIDKHRKAALKIKLLLKTTTATVL